MAKTTRVQSNTPTQRKEITVAREVRVSPDGDNIAIRSDYPEDGPMAYGYFNVINGGGWCGKDQVSDWGTPDNITFPEPPAPAEEPTP